MPTGAYGLGGRQQDFQLMPASLQKICTYVLFDAIVVAQLVRLKFHAGSQMICKSRRRYFDESMKT